MTANDSGRSLGNSPKFGKGKNIKLQVTREVQTIGASKNGCERMGSDTLSRIWRIVEKLNGCDCERTRQL